MKQTLKILVIDDERWIRKGICKLIGEIQFLGNSQTFEASNLTEAYEIFLKESPQIILSDIQMPNENGCDFCEKVYQENKKVKFIMITGYDKFTYAKKAIEFQAIEYLLKPVDKGELETAIKKALEALPELKIPIVKEEKIVSKQGVDRIVKEIIEIIQGDVCGKYSLAYFTERFFVNSTYLSTIFKNQVGTSLSVYIMEAKIKKAQELFLMTNLKIVEVGEYVGYPDQHYFSKVFKKITGETPSEFKNKIKVMREDG